jgi:hypothetical protein
VGVGVGGGGGGRRGASCCHRCPDLFGVACAGHGPDMSREVTAVTRPLVKSQPGMLPSTRPRTSPQPTSPQPTSPQPTSPQPMSPQPTSPQNTSPQNTSPQNTSPQATYVPPGHVPSGHVPSGHVPSGHGPAHPPRPRSSSPSALRGRPRRAGGVAGGDAGFALS